MSFYCKLCDFSTQNKYNYNIHLETDKHKQHEKEQFKCEDCKKTFACKQNLQNHFNTKAHQDMAKNRKDELSELKERVKHLELREKDLECDLKISKNNNENKDILLHEKDKLLQEKNNSITSAKQELKRSQKINDKSLDIINRLTKRYPNAPPLEKIKDCKKMQGNKSNKDFARCLLHSYTEGRLDEEIGKHLLSVYKKNNPKLQSIWNIDSKRLDYIISIIKNADKKTFKWKKDEHGAQINDDIIRPLLDSLHDAATLGIIKMRAEDNLTKRENNYREKFLKELKSNELAKRILIYMAYRLSITEMILEEESSDSNSSDRESSDSNSSDGESSDGESFDKESSDEESSDEESSDGESSDEESSNGESSDEESSDGGSSDRESSDDE